MQLFTTLSVPNDDERLRKPRIPAPKASNLQVSTITDVVEHALVGESRELGLLQDVKVFVSLRQHIRFDRDPKLVHSWVRCFLNHTFQ